jgi:signal transduction histidine kinase
VWRTSFKKREITFYKSLSEYERKLSFDEFQGYFIDEDGTIDRNFKDPEAYFDKPVSYLCHMHSVFHETDVLQWNMIDSIPVFGSDGKMEGCFGTIRNMTALIQAQEHLKEETRRANDSGRLKSVFMANMTHEIRTPLNSIVGFSDLLPMMQSQDDKRELVKVIRNNCDMLLRLINDILEISTMDSQAIVLNPVDADFAVEFGKICQSLSERVQEPSVEFICDNPGEPLPVHLDIQRVQQVVTNFVTNAVKYTHQGHIRVGYRQESRIMMSPEGEKPVAGLYIYCEDTGAGIPKEKQTAVFERFVKLNDFVQGTGLGLSICKAIAEKSGGQIGVESEGENQGSTFWIWLPINS